MSHQTLFELADTAITLLPLLAAAAFVTILGYRLHVTH
jgi:hypothetical protein